MKRTAATLLIGLGTGLALTACNPAPLPLIGDAITVERDAPATTTIPTRTIHGRAMLPNSCTWVTKQDADGTIRARWEDGRQSPCDPANFDPFGYLDNTGWQGP